MHFIEMNNSCFTELKGSHLYALLPVILLFLYPVCLICAFIDFVFTLQDCCLCSDM